MLRNITLSAEEKLIKKAREKAHREHTTLNENFRIWLKRYTNAEHVGSNYQRLMDKFIYANSGRKFSREELNER